MVCLSRSWFVVTALRRPDNQLRGRGMSDPAWAVAMRSRIAELEAKLQEEAAREPAPSTTHSPSIVSELAPSKKQSAPSVAGPSLQVTGSRVRSMQD